MVLDLYPGCRRYDTKLTVGAGSQSSSPLEGPRSVELTIHYLLKKRLWRFLGIGDPKNRGGRLSRRGVDSAVVVWSIVIVMSKKIPRANS